MIKTMGKIVYYAFLGFLGIIALAIISTLFPIPGNFQVLVVQSGSMEPDIPTGSVVIIKPTTEYGIGDVITFGPVSRVKPPTTHRIVEAQGETYKTKGDANNNIDPQAVEKRHVLGKVLFDVPYLGYILDFARQPLGFALIIGVPAVLIIGDEIRKIFVETKKIMGKKSREKNAKS